MTLIIAAAQSAPSPGDVSENLACHLQFAETAAEHWVQLLVFPELSLTGYDMRRAREYGQPDDPRLEPMKSLPRDDGMAVVVGAPLLNDAQALHIAALAIRDIA